MKKWPVNPLKTINITLINLIFQAVTTAGHPANRDATSVEIPAPADAVDREHRQSPDWRTGKSGEGVTALQGSGQSCGWGGEVGHEPPTIGRNPTSFGYFEHHSERPSGRAGVQFVRHRFD